MDFYKFYFIINFLYIIFSLINRDDHESKYILISNNTLNTTNIDNEIIDSIFNFINNLLIVIQNCVMEYFFIFKQLFHYCVYTILFSLETYFVIFNNIFISFLNTFYTLIIGYFNILELVIVLALSWPNNIVLALLVNSILFWIYKLNQNNILV